MGPPLWLVGALYFMEIVNLQLDGHTFYGSVISGKNSKWFLYSVEELEGDASEGIRCILVVKRITDGKLFAFPFMKHGRDVDVSAESLFEVREKVVEIKEIVLADGCAWEDIFNG